MKTLLLSVFYLSLSFRSAYVPKTPYDWEFTVGSESKHGRLEYLVERENGVNYYGVDTRADFDIGPIVLNLENYKKTAKNIDNQRAGISFPSRWPVKASILTFYDRWGYEGVRWGLNGKIWGVSGRVEWHGNDFASAEATMSRTFEPAWARGKPYAIALEPLAIYRKEKDVEFWQAKIRLKFSKRNDAI